MTESAGKPVRRILVLTSTPRQPDNRLLWEGLRRFAEVDIHFIEKERQRNLRKILAAFELSGYDRIVVDLRFRYLSRQARTLKSVKNLIIYEEDGNQNFVSGSRWHGRFTAFYRKIPHARIIFTGFSVSERFSKMGIDARFLPKGYDSAHLYHIPDAAKDIELGFIGRVASSLYSKRKELLETAARNFGLQMLRTEPGDEYRDGLNRIKIFVSADIGFSEYMAKNFEAMACGCALLAYRQGQGEEEALGLKDGTHLLLYGNYDEFAEKLTRLRSDDALIERLSREGETFVKAHFDYLNLSQRFYAHLSGDMAEPKSPSTFTARILRRLFG